MPVKDIKDHRYKHGHASSKNHSRTYNSFHNMIQRCTNPNNTKYHLYGARGINVSNEWVHSFENFLRDMGERPKETSLDRIDNSKGYYKENCRWANRYVQARNKRRTHDLKNDL